VRRPLPRNAETAYHHFSYDVEKAGCNADVLRVIAAARKADKAVTPQTESFYGLSLKSWRARAVTVGRLSTSV
jgi:hypothetical protein